MSGFIGTSITITINYNSSQSMTVSDSLHSLLGYEHLPLCDWLGSDLQISHLRITKDEWRMKTHLRLNHWTPLPMTTHECPLFYNSRRTEDSPPPRTFCLVIICFIRCYKTCVNVMATFWFLQAYLLLRNTLLESCCLAMDYSVTIWSKPVTVERDFLFSLVLIIVSIEISSHLWLT
jgi:hypothetical protein